MAGNNPSSAYSMDAVSRERLDGVLSSLEQIHARLAVLSLAFDGLWFATTDMGAGRRHTTGADYDDLRTMTRQIAGDVMWQINEIETIPALEKGGVA